MIKQAMHPADVAVRGLQQQDAAEQEDEKESWTVISSAMSRDGTRWWREKKKKAAAVLLGDRIEKGGGSCRAGGGGCLASFCAFHFFFNFAPRQHAESEEEARLPKMTAATVIRDIDESTRRTMR